MVDVKETEERIERNKLSLKNLEEKYLRAYCPQSVPEGTSYTDYDSIHGSKKEYRVEEYFREKQRLLAMIELDRDLIIAAGIVSDEVEYLNLLDTNLQRVKYLRKVKGYTQEETSTKIDISVRQVQRIEKELKMS